MYTDIFCGFYCPILEVYTKKVLIDLMKKCIERYIKMVYLKQIDLTLDKCYDTKLETKPISPPNTTTIYFSISVNTEQRPLFNSYL